MKKIAPEIGCWYKELPQGSIFEVVAVDETYDTVEAQMVDGELCEFDMETWEELVLETVEEPEDWRNPFELSGDDYRNADDTLRPDDWNNPLVNIETDIINGLMDDGY